jgi:hypothetical protein
MQFHLSKSLLKLTILFEIRPKKSQLNNCLGGGESYDLIMVTQNLFNSKVEKGNDDD